MITKIKTLSLIFLSSLFGIAAASEERMDLGAPSNSKKFAAHNAGPGPQSDSFNELMEGSSTEKVIPLKAEELLKHLIQQISEYDQRTSREAEKSQEEIRQLKTALELERTQHQEALKQYEEALGLYATTQSALEEMVAENLRLTNILTDLKQLHEAHRNKDQDPRDLGTSRTTKEALAPVLSAPAVSGLGSHSVTLSRDAVAKVEDKQLFDQEKAESQKKEQIVKMMFEMDERHNRELADLEQKILRYADLEAQLQEALAEKELAQAEVAVAETKLRRETKIFKVLLKIAEGKASVAENHLLGIEKTADRFHEQLGILLGRTKQEPEDFDVASALSELDESRFEVRPIESLLREPNQGPEDFNTASAFKELDESRYKSHQKSW